MASGTRAQLLEVQVKDGRYAAKVKVIHSSRPGQKTSAQTDSVQWVDFNPETPFLQIYNERTGAVNPLAKYLDLAAKGEKVNIPEFEEPEDIDAIAEAELENAPSGDDPGAAPQSSQVIASEEQIPDQNEF